LLNFPNVPVGSQIRSFRRAVEPLVINPQQNPLVTVFGPSLVNDCGLEDSVHDNFGHQPVVQRVGVNRCLGALLSRVGEGTPFLLAHPSLQITKAGAKGTLCVETLRTGVSDDR
jgi:hypothetical protein